jgi:HEAT repeat protein
MIAQEESIPHLLPLLQDEDAEVQAVVITALGEIGGDTAKAALEDLLADAEPALRELVLPALADVDFAEDPLSFSAKDEDGDAEDAES